MTARYAGLAALAKGLEDSTGVHGAGAGMAASLDEGIMRMGGSEAELFVVSKVEAVDEGP